MEAMVKKYQQRFRKVKAEMETWAELQSLLISQFRIASSIIQRLKVLQDSNNYGGGLVGVSHIQEAVLGKQMESLQKLLISMNNTMEQFHAIVLSLGRIHRDGRQMIKGGSSQVPFKVCIGFSTIRTYFEAQEGDFLVVKILFHSSGVRITLTSRARSCTIVYTQRQSWKAV